MRVGYVKLLVFWLMSSWFITLGPALMSGLVIGFWCPLLKDDLADMPSRNTIYLLESSFKSSRTKTSLLRKSKHHKAHVYKPGLHVKLSSSTKWCNQFLRFPGWILLFPLLLNSKLRFLCGWYFRMFTVEMNHLSFWKYIIVYTYIWCHLICQRRHEWLILHVF